MDTQASKADPIAVPGLDQRISDLRRQLAQLEAEQRAAERKHRDEVLQAIRSLLQQHGFKPSELAVRTNRGGAKRSSVAPLYRDPASGATWSGRGTEPAWIKGRDRRAFKVAK